MRDEDPGVRARLAEAQGLDVPGVARADAHVDALAHGRVTVLVGIVDPDEDRVARVHRPGLGERQGTGCIDRADARHARRGQRHVPGAAETLCRAGRGTQRHVRDTGGIARQRHAPARGRRLGTQRHFVGQRGARLALHRVRDLGDVAQHRPRRCRLRDRQQRQQPGQQQAGPGFHGRRCARGGAVARSASRTPERVDRHAHVLARRSSARPIS